MKILIGIVVASLMFANIGFAEMRLIEEEKIRTGKEFNYIISTVCIDGYKFVMTAVTGGRSMVQFYENADESDHYLIVPAKC